MKKKQQEKMNIRCWIVVFVLLTVLGLLFVNSIYLDGYYCTEYSYESGNLIADSYGYTVENNSFQYTGDEGSYVQISGVEGPVDQLMLVFNDQAEKDEEVFVNYVDDEGNILELVSQATWKKDTNTVKIDMEEGEYNSYLLLLSCNFTLSRVYYAAENGYEGISRVEWTFGVMVLVVILTVLLLSISKTRVLIESADRKVVDWLQKIKENRKDVGKKVLLFDGIILAGVLVSYVVIKAKGYTFSGKTALLTVLVGALAAMFILCYKNLAKQIEVIGFFAILLTGSMFALTEPANVGVSWDDEIHFRNAVQLSHVFDGQISGADLTIIDDYTWVALEKKNYNREQQKQYNQLMDELVDSHYYAQRSGFSPKNTLIAYVPSAIGLILARGMGLPFDITLAVGRWMNTLLLAILSYFAMKKLKSGKIVVLLIALLPTNIFIAGNYTYDTWLTAWSILGLSTFFGEWQQPEKKMDRFTPWLIGISMYLAVLPKQVYFPLTFIALFLPLSKFHSKKECWMYRIIILAAAVLPFITVYLQNIAGSGMGQGDIRGGEAVDATSQMDFVRSNPLQSAKILLNFLKIYLNPFVEGKEYISNIAYLGYTPVNGIFLLVTVLAGALVSREEGETRFPWWTRAGVLLVYAVIGFIAAFSMYVAFTAVGADTVAGCQGRYLMPALFPLVYVLSRFSFKTWVKGWLKERNINLVLMLILVVSSVWGLWTGCISLY